ncbi:MAG: outer membrane protein assembly factor BamE [Pseudomonadales bacterium]|nr:outer membrane protein assembly factor BamE [Pseudomonadales bacterium]
MRTLIPLFFVQFFLAACSTTDFPFVHRLTIQQGNVITQSMIDKLKPGMTKSQVRYVLGNAVVDDSLVRNRWDYIYSIQVPGNELVQKKLQIYFVEDRLSYFEGDYAPTESKPELDS